MSECGEEVIARTIINILKEGPLTSKEIITKLEDLTECAVSPTDIREVLAQLVREGLVLKVLRDRGSKNVFIFRISPHALDAIQ